LDENPELMFEYIMIGQQQEVQQGEGEFTWDVPRYFHERFIEIGDTFYVVGGAIDANPENLTVSVAAGQVRMTPQSVSEPNAIVTAYDLSAPFPNPFNSSMTIEYSIPTADRVSMIVYDLSGRIVATLVDGMSTAGLHNITWSPDNVSAGVYLLELKAGGNRFVRKAVYMP
jgi:hypothetical protein